MSLYRSWKSDPYSIAAIWKIEESEEWFTRQISVFPTAAFPQKRLEFLAARYLLTLLYPEFPLSTIQADEQGKPRLPQNQLEFSLSHSFPYVAAVISKDKPCGIDIQVWKNQVTRLQHKFLSPKEQLFFHNDMQQLLMAWCAKEAAYKWQGLRATAFIEHLQIQQYLSQDTHYEMQVLLTKNNPHTRLSIETSIHPDFAFAIVTNR